MPEKMDGLISFYASHHAIRAEKVLREAEFLAALIPGPRELSPNCGVALRFEYARSEAALAILADKKVQIETIHKYHPRVANWTETAPAANATTRHLGIAGLFKR